MKNWIIDTTTPAGCKGTNNYLNRQAISKIIASIAGKFKANGLRLVDFSESEGQVTTSPPLAVFGSRYGEEIVEWFRKHPEIRLVSRDGSQMYSRLKKIMAHARELAQVISRGCLTPEVMDKRMNGKLGSYLAHRATRTIRQKYTEIRANVRENNNKLKKQKVRVSKKAIWSYIMEGKTDCDKLKNLSRTHPYAEQAIKACVELVMIIKGKEGKILQCTSNDPPMQSRCKADANSMQIRWKVDQRAEKEHS